MILDEMCPVHLFQLVSVEQKPQLLGRCPMKSCFYGILTDALARTVVDISEHNYTIDGQECETLN